MTIFDDNAKENIKNIIKAVGLVKTPLTLLFPYSISFSVHINSI